MLPQYYEAKKTVLPILLARGSVVFPNQVIHFDLESEEAESVLEWATRNHSPVVVVSMLDPTIEEPKLGDFAEFGTISTIRQSFRLPGGPSKVVVEGNARAKSRALCAPIHTSKEKCWNTRILRTASSRTRN